MQREQRQSSRGLGRALAFSGALALAFTGSGAAFASSTNPIAAAEWALNTLNVTQVRNLGAHGAGVIVAVIDSGVDPNQPDLKGRLVDGVNLVNPSSPTSNYSDTDSESHGTSVATVIAAYPHTASDGSSYGMIGLADKAEIMPVKVDNGGGIGSFEGTLAGIKYAVNHGAQVINISIADTATSPDMTNAINMALAHGVVVVVGTGNDSNTGNAANSYATVPGVLDVAGIDSNGQKYSFGHYGSDVNIAAPANSIEVGLINGKYDENSGTSFATPWVSGEAALLIAEHPAWTSGQIVATIIDNTQQVANGTTKAGQRYNNDFGYGVIDPVAALKASEPSSAANPLGGPAITSNPAENVKNSSSASAGASSGATPGTTATAGKSSSKMPLIIGVVVAAVVVVGLLIFLLSRGSRNRGGKGGPGGGGGGGGNGYYPPQAPPPPGGQYGQQAPGQYGQPQGPQYQQPQPNPYQPQPHQQPQQPPPGYPPQGQGGGYGQQNPYSGR